MIEKLPGQQTALQKKTHTKTRTPHTKTKDEWPGQTTALPRTHTKTRTPHPKTMVEWPGQKTALPK